MVNNHKAREGRREAMSKILTTGWVPVCPPNEPAWKYTAGPWWYHAASRRVDSKQAVTDSTGTAWEILYRRGWRLRKCCAL